MHAVPRVGFSIPQLIKVLIDAVELTKSHFLSLFCCYFFLNNFWLCETTVMPNLTLLNSLNMFVRREISFTNFVIDLK